MANHGERAHAVLSASAAHRWMRCTPSARLEEEFPNHDTVYSIEGTKAHEMAEMLLRKWIDSDYSAIPSDECVDDKEMYASVFPYVEYVTETYMSEKAQSSDAVLFLEQKLDMRPTIPEGFGTGDAIIICKNRLHVIDLKYGKGVKVSAKDNEQLRCYAMGAYNLFNELYENIDHVVMAIVQPRLDHISIDECPLQEITEWVSEKLSPKAKLAYDGRGEYVAGDHCRFCKAGGACRARAEKNLEMAKSDFISPDLLSESEVAEILPVVDQISNWVDSVKEYALQQAKLGNQIPGYKLVEGRSVRIYTDQDKVIQSLKKQGYAEAVLFEPRKLLGISKLEKMISKSCFKAYLEDKGLVIKPRGKPTLVPVSDKRSEIAPDALKDFETIKAAD